jgi:DNA helicase-2/ATP-dependent DNA helicase PcrA
MFMNDYRRQKLAQIHSDNSQLEAFKSKDTTAVIAGPGSGKTTVLSLKVLSLLNGEIRDPQGLSCITFSREAAREIKARLVKLGFNAKGNSFFGTVHSFCIAEVLVKFGRLFDHFVLPDPIRIASKKDRDLAFKQALTNLRFDAKQVSILEMNRERKIGIQGLSKVEIPSYDIALQVATEYEDILHSKGVMDFEDIVNYSTVLIQREPFVRKCLEARFPWLLIDEYQDLGRPLHEIVLALLTRTNIKVFAVGDPDQSIYGFQGAVPQYLSELATFTRVKKVILEKNYRSNQDIVDASEMVLESVRGYVAGTRQKERALIEFFTCEADMSDQYDLVADSLVPKYVKLGIPLEEIAILVGSNLEVESLSRILAINKIPHYISRHDFERTDFIKFLEECARWLVDSYSISFDSLCQYWLELAGEENAVDATKVILLRSQLYDCLITSQRLTDSLLKWVDFLIETLSIERLLARSPLLTEESENLEEFRTVIQKAPERYTFQNFSELGRPHEQVTISTRHSSKGLEFEVVIMLGMDEEKFPNYYALNDAEKLAEATRICFVCVSRAKRICCLVRSKKYTMNGRNGPWEKAFAPSRYWEILERWQLSQQVKL